MEVSVDSSEEVPVTRAIAGMTGAEFAESIGRKPKAFGRNYKQLEGVMPKGVYDRGKAKKRETARPAEVPVNRGGGEI